MPKGHKSTGGYIGAVGSYTLGGRFDLPSQQPLAGSNNWGGILSTGLQIYLDATRYSGSGTTWADQSGNGRNFTWSSGPSYVSGSVPYFNTNGYGATGPAANSVGITNSSGYTIFLVASQNSLVNTQAFEFYTSNSGTSRGIFSHATWSDGNIYWDQGGCCNSDTRTSIAMTSPSTGAWKVIAYRSNAVNERSIWQNGVSTVSNTATPAAINLNGTAIALATGEYGTTWDAKLSQFAVYNRALSDAEIVTVTNYLKTKVGL